MKGEGVYIFTDWLDQTEALTDAEKGRLIDAILLYRKTGTMPAERLSGNERFAFPFFKTRIDVEREKEAEISAKRATAGRAGGLAKASNCQQELANASKPSKGIYQDQDQDQDEHEHQDEHHHHHQEQAYAREEETGGGGGGMHDDLLKKFSDTLGRLTLANAQEFNAFADRFPEKVMLYALNEASANGKTTWAYVRGILTRIAGQGLQTLEEVQAADKAHTASTTTPAAPSNPNPALNYPQRDYKPDEFGDDFFFDPLKHGYGEGGADA